MTTAQTLVRPLTAGVGVSLNWRTLGMGVFLALSLTDLLFTWYLVETGGECFYEANPVAAIVLDRAGWFGLGCYKFACAGAVLAVVALLAHRRPRLSRNLLSLACLVVAGVIGYSGYLLADNWTDHHELSAARTQRNVLEVAFVEQKAFAVTMNELAWEVANGNLTLEQATHLLHDYVASFEGYDPLPTLRALYDVDDRACLAAHVVRFVGFVIKDRSEVLLPPLGRLEKEFNALFQCALPRIAVETYLPGGSSDGYRSPSDGFRNTI